MKMTKADAKMAIRGAIVMFRRSALLDRNEAIQQMRQLNLLEKYFIDEIKLGKDEKITRKVAGQTLATAFYFANNGHEKYKLADALIEMFQRIKAKAAWDEA